MDLKANIADLGTAAYTDSTDYATAAQGTKADSALQPGDNVSELVNDAGYLTQHQTLADLGITATATELNYVDGVTSAIQTQIDGKQPKSASAYNMGNTSGGWTAMSTAQQDALNSGATTTNIRQIATNTSNIADVATAISGKQDTLTAGTNITITGTTISATDTTYSEFTGATAGDAGTHGLVPAPAAGDQAKFLQGDGTWANPTAATAWGNITGTLSNQTDLQNALNAKANDNAVVHSTGAEVIAGPKTFQDARMTQEITSGSYLDFYQSIDGARRGAMRTWKDSNDANHYYTIFGNCGPNAEAPQGLAVHRNASTIWTTAITPDSGDNSSKIATTEWVHSAAPNLAMPSGRYTNLTLGASGASYTAPADGYIYLNKTASAVNQIITIINDSNGMRVSDTSVTASGWIATYLPVSKGQSIRITYTAGGTTNAFKFIYANGVE